MNEVKSRKINWQGLLSTNSSEYFVAICLIVVCILLSIVSPAFLSGKNILNILVQTSINSIVAIGMTLVVLTSGIDLSVGSVVALTGVSVGISFVAMGSDITNTGIGLACILIGLVVGAITGFFNGILIAQIKMPPFIATLGSMSIARGLGLMMSNGSTTVGLPNVIGFLGSGRIGFIYTPIVLMLILYGVFWWILRYTKFGRNIYAIGGNMEAAKLSGIKVKKTLLGVYVLSGICTSIAAIVLIGRLNSASPTAGKSYEMDAIAATVIGGTSMNGGEGKIIGTLVGALFIAVLRNGLNLLNVSSYSTEIFVGVLIVVAVMMDTIRQSKNA